MAMYKGAVQKVRVPTEGAPQAFNKKAFHPGNPEQDATCKRNDLNNKWGGGHDLIKHSSLYLS